MFNPALIKPVLGFTVGVCTSSTVSRLVKTVVPATTNLQKVQVTVAAIGLGSAAGGAASRQIIRDVEEIESAVRTYKEYQKAQA